MSTTYRVIAGDTFESIARKVYGTEVEAGRLAIANPGVSEPLTAGTTLNTPAAPEAPQNVPQQAAAGTEDEVAVLIEGSRFRFWNEISVTRSIDSMDVVEFGTPFDSTAPGFRSTFRPLSYKPMAVTVGGAPLFTGTMVNPTPSLKKTKTLTVSGYSLPGVLNDCTPPADPQLREFNNQNLREIATAIAAPFGIGVDFRADPGPAFERVAREPTKKALTFLAELAQQRNIIISSTERGKLLFWQSVEPGNPVARLQQGTAPVLSVEPTILPQEYYSDIIGIEPTIVGLPGGQFTGKNSRLAGVVRPFTFNVPDAIGAELSAAVYAKAGRMFGKAVSYAVEVPTWRDPAGELWTPNTTLSLIAPDAMIYSEYEFLIKSVSFKRASKTSTAVLTLVLPGAFSGKIPESLPWDE